MRRGVFEHIKTYPSFLKHRDQFDVTKKTYSIDLSNAGFVY